MNTTVSSATFGLAAFLSVFLQGISRAERPADALGALVRADSLRVSGRLDEAILAYTQAIQADRGNAPAYVGRAGAWTERGV